jgi:hypothetical protein
MSAAMRTFQAVAFLRGGRISGFLDRHHTPFFLSKKLVEVLRIDERGQAVRTPQWIIELEAPVDVAALLREHEDVETALVQAAGAAGVLAGVPTMVPVDDMAPAEVPRVEPDNRRPDLQQVLALAQSFDIESERFLAYADGRWGVGWRVSAHGRARAWDELDRHRNDAGGYRDKVDAALKVRAERRAS